MGGNQDRCEGILSVVVANIVAVNCTSIHFLIKQKVSYALLSFKETFTRINEDSVSFFLFLPGQILLIIFGHNFLLCTAVYQKSRTPWD